MSTGISQGFGDVRARLHQGIPGDWVYADPDRRWSSGINSSPQAVQVTTVTVTDQGDDDDVIITINGIDVSINTGTGGTAATIGADLAEAINAEPLVRGQVRASFDTATLTLTGLTAGLEFTVSIASDPDSVLSSVTTTTAADTADAIPFGRVVVSQGSNTSESEKLVALADTTKFTAQVQTLSIAYVDTAVINISVWEIRGSERIRLAEVSEASAASQDATIDALVVLLNAALPAASVLAAANDASATAIVFTAEIPGLEFEVTWLAGHEGASLPAITIANTTGPSRSTSLHRAFAGISLYSPADECGTVGGETGQYAGNAGVKFGQRGCLWITNAETPAEADTVYVELAAGSTAGRLYAASSATRVALSKAVAVWERDGLVTADSLAAVRLK